MRSQPEPVKATHHTVQASSLFVLTSSNVTGDRGITGPWSWSSAGHCYSLPTFWCHNFLSHLSRVHPLELAGCYLTGIAGTPSLGLSLLKVNRWTGRCLLCHPVTTSWAQFMKQCEEKLRCRPAANICAWSTRAFITIILKFKVQEISWQTIRYNIFPFFLPQQIYSILSQRPKRLGSNFNFSKASSFLLERRRCPLALCCSTPPPVPT